MLLRPHHALCIRFFVGRGYSPDFTQNMKNVISRLNAGEKAQFTCALDSVCACCPNKNGNQCKSEEKVQHFDSEVMRHCNFSIEEKISWNQIYKIVSEQIIEKSGVFDSICGDCQWASLCHK